MDELRRIDVGRFAGARLYIFGRNRDYVNPPRNNPDEYLGVLTSMDMDDLMHQLIPIGVHHPNSLSEMQTFIEKAAAVFPGEVIPFNIEQWQHVIFHE